MCLSHSQCAACQQANETAQRPRALASAAFGRRRALTSSSDQRPMFAEVVVEEEFVMDSAKNHSCEQGPNVPATAFLALLVHVRNARQE